MKKLSLFLLTSSLLIATPTRADLINPMGVGGFGHTILDVPPAHVACWTVCKALAISCVACSPDVPFALSIWIDYATAMATALDAAATWSQTDRTIDAQDAVSQLEESLGGGCSGGAKDSEVSLPTNAMEVFAPQIVVDALDNYEDLESVRQAVEDYVFENDSSDINGECKDAHNKCAENRQNTWALLSVSLAQAMADKMLNNSEDMTNHFKELADQFNAQTSPMGMWGAMSAITLDTHVQMNDINALYARDLEMTALGGLNNSGTVEYSRSGTGR